MNNEFMADKIKEYNNLLVNYENSRQAYENVLTNTSATLSTSSTNTKCCRILGYLDSPRVANWFIINVDGTVIYESGVTYKDDAWVIDLNTLSMIPSSQFKVKILLGEREATCDKTFIYTPDSNTTSYLEYNNSVGIAIDLLGTVPVYYAPNAEPYLYCSGIYVLNDSGMLAKYGLYSLNGVLLYETDNFIAGQEWQISFRHLGIAEGSIFKLKAIVIAGKDNTCDITMKYVSDSSLTANFNLHGTTTKNTVMYQGTTLFEPDNLEVVDCSNIVCYNLAGVIAAWKILRLDGTLLYSSGNELQYNTWKFDFNTLGIEIGTMLRLKIAVDTRSDHYSNEIFEYTPSSATVYYDYIVKNAKGQLYYNSLVPSSNIPPIVKCSSISACHNEYPVIMKWVIFYEHSGKDLLISGRCSKGNTWNYSLKNLNVPPGTQLRLKAYVRGGSDSVAYIILEYDPDSSFNAPFGFYGNAFKTIVPYGDK